MNSEWHVCFKLDFFKLLFIIDPFAKSAQQCVCVCVNVSHLESKTAVSDNMGKQKHAQPHT